MAIPNGMMPFIDQQSMGSAFGSIPGVNRPQDAGQQQMSPLMSSQMPMNRDTATGLAILANMGYSRTPQVAMANIARGMLAGQQYHDQMQSQVLDRERVKQQMETSMMDARYKRMLLEQQNRQFRQKRETKQQQQEARRAYLMGQDVSPEMRNILATDDAAWNNYVKDQMEPKAQWSEPYEMRVGNTVAMVRRNEDTGEIKQIISGTVPKAGGTGTGLGTPGERSPENPFGLSEDDILDTNSARRMINDRGQNPPPGWRVGEALQRGFRPASNSEMKRAEEAQVVRQHIQNLRNLALGSAGPDQVMGTEDDVPGILSGMESGVIGRAKGLYESVLNTVTQNDPAWADYLAAANAAIVPIIRMLGEVGNIAQAERESAMKMLPSIGMPQGGIAPDTKEVAKRKLERLERMLEQWLTRGTQYQEGVLNAPTNQQQTPAMPGSPGLTTILEGMLGS